MAILFNQELCELCGQFAVCVCYVNVIVVHLALCVLLMCEHIFSWFWISQLARIVQLEPIA